jgi:hypothetical protein
MTYALDRASQAAVLDRLFDPSISLEENEADERQAASCRARVRMAPGEETRAEHFCRLPTITAVICYFIVINNAGPARLACRWVERQQNPSLFGQQLHRRSWQCVQR